jgi:hypothetical protein
MLFIIALEPLQRILYPATASGLLSEISQRASRMRASFYTDDTALFLNLAKEEVKIVFELLEFFGKTSRLRTSLNKCTVFSISCENLYPGVLEHLDCSIGSLPCTNLGRGSLFLELEGLH